MNIDVRLRQGRKGRTAQVRNREWERREGKRRKEMVIKRLSYYKLILGGHRVFVYEVHDFRRQTVGVKWDCNH